MSDHGGIDTTGGDCYGCEHLQGRRCHHSTVFTDSRTGRSFCHECIAALVTWELDGEPEKGEYPYMEWNGEVEANPQGRWVQAKNGRWSWVLGSQESKAT